MTILRAAILAALLLWTGHSRPAFAEDVTLTSRDGSVEIIGNLLGYDGEFYRVESEFGILTVDGSGVLCDGPGCPDLQGYVADISISGARTMGEVLMPALVQAFGARNGYRVERQVIDDTHFGYTLTDIANDRVAARIRFRVTSTSEGFADLLANEADIVLSSRQASLTEIRLAREVGLGDLADPKRRKIIALDAIVPVVSASNRFEAVTLDTLAKIFAGEIDNWSALDGPDAPISLHIRDNLSGLTTEFRRRVLLPAGMKLAETVVRHESNVDLADAVARDPYAIGIATQSEIGNAKPVTILGVCGLPAFANETSLKAENYPLTTPLFLYTPARRPPLLAREFLRFVRSDAAQIVIDRAGFVNLRLQELPVAEQGQRLANSIDYAGEEVSLDDLKRLTQRLSGTSWVSLVFRFEQGGVRLDAHSQSNVELLAHMLEQGDYNGRKLIFVGFSDSAGTASGNLRLAQRRAETVRDAVIEAAAAADRSQVRLEADAFGEAMPIACDESEWGQRINRRVEVWVGQI